MNPIRIVLATGDKKHLLLPGMRQIVTAAGFVARLKAFDIDKES